MRDVRVVLNINGEIVTGTLRVRADYLTTRTAKPIRDLLECNREYSSWRKLNEVLRSPVTNRKRVERAYTKIWSGSTLSVRAPFLFRHYRASPGLTGHT